MRLFACCFLSIFITGNVLSEVNRKCGGKIDILRERSGSIIYSFPGGVQPTSVIYNRIINNGIRKQADAICTWIIDARVNQTVWIEVIHVDEDAQLRIQFSNDTAVKKLEKGVRMLFSGAGRTTVEWSLRNVVKAPNTLNLRWNTSEDSHDLAQVPYTHSDSDPVSPSPDSTNRVTRPPDKPGLESVSLHTHTLRGGGVSGPKDKSRPPFPQENAHNEQEKAGTVISNLTHTALLAHAGTHTHSSGSYTHTNAQTVMQTIPALLLASAKTQSPRVSRHNLARHQDVATATAAYLNTDGDNAAYRPTTTNVLTRRSPSTGMHIATNVYFDKHNSIENAPLSPTIPLARSHTVSSVHSDRDPEASDAVSSEQDFYTVTYTSDNKMTAPTDGRVSTVAASGSKNQPPTTTAAASPDNRALGTETGRTNRYPRSSQTNQENSNRTNPSVFEDSDTVTGTSVSVTHDQAKRSVLTDQYTAAQSHATSSTKATEHTFVVEHHTHGLYHTHFPNMYMPRVESQDSMDTYTSHTILSERSTIAQQTSSTLQPSATKQLGSTESLNLSTQHNTNPSSVFRVFGVTTPSDLPVSPVTSVEGETKHRRRFSFTSAPKSPNMGSQDGEREEMNSNVFSSTMTILSVHPSPQINPAVTPDLTTPTPPESSNEVSTVSPSSALSAESPSSALSTETHTPSPQETELYAHKRKQDVLHTLGPQLSSTAVRHTETDAAMRRSTPFTLMDHSGPGSHGNSSRSTVLLDPRTPISFSPSVSAVSGSVEATHGAWTHSNDRVTPTAAGHVITLSSVGSTAGEDVNTRRPLYKDINQTQVTHSPLTTPPWPKPTPTRHQDSRSTPTIQTYGLVEQLGTRTLAMQNNTNPSDPTGAYPPYTAAVTHTPWLRPFTVKNDKDWSHKGRDFIVEDQPATIKVETFQVLLQVVLEQNSSFPVGLMEVEPFLHRVAGYQHQHLTWHSGPVFQTVVTFKTMEAFSWLGRAESLLSQARLTPLPKEGLFVGGVRVKNITVGGLHSDVCSWLFECPPGFQCKTSEGNASCTSVCHSEYCRHHGICVHRPGVPPLCQCPVGEDFWFMGRRCDLRMTRQRLVGMCVGVLGVAAALMALLSYLAVRRFKSMMIQAKVDQTRSRYRRFNHFDELSARFWGRSWPGSEDSLDNPAFTHSDELLHMRALDRTCCYHDDTLSVTSTYQGSATHLSTVYPHSSQYHWNLSNCSLADCVIDSGKASDLSVCSWPIEPIQWTPFPLLQQLNRNDNSVKVSRPRSYCEGMELVDLEKSWTA